MTVNRVQAETKIQGELPKEVNPKKSRPNINVADPTNPEAKSLIGRGTSAPDSKTTYSLKQLARNFFGGIFVRIKVYFSCKDLAAEAYEKKVHLAELKDRVEAYPKHPLAGSDIKLFSEMVVENEVNGSMVMQFHSNPDLKKAITPAAKKKIVEAAAKHAKRAYSIDYLKVPKDLQNHQHQLFFAERIAGLDANFGANSLDEVKKILEDLYLLQLSAESEKDEIVSLNLEKLVETLSPLYEVSFPGTDKMIFSGDSLGKERDLGKIILQNTDVKNLFEKINLVKKIENSPDPLSINTQDYPLFAEIFDKIVHLPSNHSNDKLLDKLMIILSTNKGLYASMVKAETDQERVLSEFYQTEITFVNGLKKMVKVLKNGKAEKKYKKEIEIIEGFIRQGDSLIKNLSSEKSVEEKLKVLAAHFETNSERIEKNYGEYINRFDSFQDEVLKDFGKVEGFSDLPILIVQRLPRYEMLSKEIAKKSNIPAHKDKMESLSAKIHDLTMRCNEASKELDKKVLESDKKAKKLEKRLGEIREALKKEGLSEEEREELVMKRDEKTEMFNERMMRARYHFFYGRNKHLSKPTPPAA